MRGPGGPVFAGKEAGVIVFRATLFSVVLMFAGPSVPLLCRAWCGPQAAAETSCHLEDNGSKTGVSSGDCCPDQALSPAVPSQGLGRHPSLGPALALLVPRFQMTAPASNVRPTDVPGAKLPVHRPPLSTPLRI